MVAKASATSRRCRRSAAAPHHPGRPPGDRDARRAHAGRGWPYAIVTPDGRTAIAEATKGDEAVVLTCQQLDVDPVRIKGRDGTEPRSHGHGMTESAGIEEFRDLQLLIAYREDQLTR